MTLILHNDISASHIHVTEEIKMESGSRISGSLIPVVTDDPGHSLGDPNVPWKDAYLSSGSLFIDGVKTLHREGGLMKLGTGEDFDVSGSLSGSMGHFRGDVKLVGDPNTAMDLRVISDGGKSRIHIIAHGDSGSNSFPVLRLERAQGSKANPSDIVAGTKLGLINFVGRESGSRKRLASIELRAGGTFGSGNTPTKWIFRGIRTGSTTLERQWMIDEDAAFIPGVDNFDLGRPGKRVGTLFAQTLNVTQKATIPRELFYGFGPTADLDISTGGWVDVPLDNVRRIDAPFSHSLGTAVIEFTENVNLEISYHVSTDISTGTSRSKSSTRLVIDTGGGFVGVPDTIKDMYNRNATQGGNNASANLYRSVNVGDKIKLQARRRNGTSTVIISAKSAGLKFKVV